MGKCIKKHAIAIWLTIRPRKAPHNNWVRCHCWRIIYSRTSTTMTESTMRWKTMLMTVHHNTVQMIPPSNRHIKGNYTPFICLAVGDDRARTTSVGFLSPTYHYHTQIGNKNIRWKNSDLYSLSSKFFLWVYRQWYDQKILFSSSSSLNVCYSTSRSEPYSIVFLSLSLSLTPSMYILF